MNPILAKILADLEGAITNSASLGDATKIYTDAKALTAAALAVVADVEAIVVKLKALGA